MLTCWVPYMLVSSYVMSKYVRCYRIALLPDMEHSRLVLDWIYYFIASDGPW